MGQQLCPCEGQDNSFFILPPIYISQNEFSEVQQNQMCSMIIQKFVKSDPDYNNDKLKKTKFHVKKQSKNVYVGQFKQGKANGFGITYFQQILIYYGQFVKGLPYGNGTLKKLKKTNQKQQHIIQCFKGQFIDGVANGQGLYKNFQMQFSFNGKWQQVKKPYVHSVPINGILVFQNNKLINSVQFENFIKKDAIITYQNGDKYTGFVNQSKICPNGIGKMDYSCGDVYQGQWKDGKIHGAGTYEWKSGQKYIGDYVNGQKQGNGVLYLKSGHKFVGSWKHGKKNGYGKFVNEKELLDKQGFWVQDVIDEEKSKQLSSILKAQNMPFKDLISELGQNSQKVQKEEEEKIVSKLNKIKQEQQKYVQKLFNQYPAD